MSAGEGSAKLPFLVSSSDSPWCRCSDNTPPAVEPAQLPMFVFSHDAVEMFDPARHLTSMPKAHGGPSAARTPLPLAVAARANPKTLLIPREEDCFALWDRYAMLDNIREHSKKVAGLALALANAAKEKGFAVCPEAVYAAGLLHDLAKTYTIQHNGHHAQLGGAWVMRET
ncbi:HD domain-containing protein, partial [Desulfovibrio sp. OttesenSCG-928-G15]|nr:HD domain-containing protein [Desulfovibrio sp. OttesenSCG-928-G15]